MEDFSAFTKFLPELAETVIAGSKKTGIRAGGEERIYFERDFQRGRAVQ